MEYLVGRTCLVTGGGRGIGRAIVKGFASLGANIALAYQSHKLEAEEAAYLIRRINSVGCLLVQGNVACESDVQRMVEEVKQKFGRVDILVNNAGVHLDGMSWKLDAAAWNEVLAVNLTGAFLCIKHVLPFMRGRGWGRIVNVGSVVASTGLAGACNYSASKAGLEGLTRSVAREVADKNITVNCVAYGYMDAGMNLTLPKAVKEKVFQNIPLGRFGSLREAVGPVLFLCSEAAGYVTGQTIHVNGGLSMGC